MDLLIRGGLVYDGTGALPVRADVRVGGRLITDIGPHLAARGAKILDAEGKIVTPGFVDIHRHCDIAPLRDENFGELELAQGITTAVVGNCGLAPVPTRPASRSEVHDFLAPVTGLVPEGMAFERYGQWLDALEDKGLPLNLGFLVGAGAVRTAVNGFANAALTTEQLQDAAALVRDGMEAGALGLSLGLMYQPECWAARSEIIVLAKAAAGQNGVLTTHVRGEGDSLVESVAEVIGIATEAGLPLNISHFKATGISNWRSTIFKAIELVESARAKGQPVAVDFYPYTGGATTLLSLLPPVLLEDELAALRCSLATREGKQRLRDALAKDYPGWDNMVKSIGWQRILLSSPGGEENRSLAGKSLAEAAALGGYSDPADLVADLIAEEGDAAGIIVMSMCQEDVDEVARLPYAALISDGLYTDGANPHPRLYGAFPKFLRDYVVNRPLLPMEQAIHKMTSMPARRMGLQKRGVLKVGNYADVLVFDPAAFCDKATFADARHLAEGMAYALVNGTIVWHKDSIQNNGHGSLVKRRGNENGYL